MVVVTPEVGVSTPKAFADWDRLCGAGRAAELRSARTLGSAQGRHQLTSPPHEIDAYPARPIDCLRLAARFRRG